MNCVSANNAYSVSQKLERGLVVFIQKLIKKFNVQELNMVTNYGEDSNVIYTMVLALDGSSKQFYHMCSQVRIKK